ncbi:Protein 21.1 [Giardia lamblia P15]|uniref:Protein 21.1 n=1 Tax=Giardia intestinalis (strain P15) TaxID=658858 RepID=E1F4D7_GIAIA|nr:Protein 21.1 [Giardia lamblia P15]
MTSKPFDSSQWMKAAEIGDVVFLSKHLTNFKRSQDGAGRTALMRAVLGVAHSTDPLRGSKDMRHYSDPRELSHTGTGSSLNVSAVTLLARHEGGMVDNSGSTALCYAAESNNAPACITLLPLEGTIIPDNGFSPLMRAARNRSMDALPILIKTHAPVLRDFQGYSALDHACLSSSVEAVEYLINNGHGTIIADINRAISAANSVRASSIVDLLAYVRLARINNTTPCTKCWHSEIERRLADSRLQELERKCEALATERPDHSRRLSGSSVSAMSTTMDATMSNYRISYLQRLLSQLINEGVSAGVYDISLSSKSELYTYSDIGRHCKAILQAFKRRSGAQTKEEAKYEELKARLTSMHSEISIYKEELSIAYKKIAALTHCVETIDVASQTEPLAPQNTAVAKDSTLRELRRSSIILDTLTSSTLQPPISAPPAKVNLGVSSSQFDIELHKALLSGIPSPRGNLSDPYGDENIECELSDIAMEQPPLKELRSSAVLFDSKANTLLMQAALLGDLEMAESLLVQAGATNKSGRTALMMAASAGNADIVALLIETGKEARKQDSEGRTALYFAVKGLHYSSIRHLAPYEAGLQKSDGQTSLMIGAKRGGKTLLELLDVEIGMQSTDGWTALMAAADSGNIEACMHLASREAGLSMKSGWTALMSAAWNGHLEIVSLLCEREAGMQKVNGFTALMAAARNGNLECLKILMPREYGLVQVSGKTVLEWCKEYNQNDCTEYTVNYANSLGQPNPN